MSITPYAVSANGLWNPFTQRKRFTVTCGSCDHTYKDKVICQTDKLSSICPNCRRLNIWSLSVFTDRYEKYLQSRHS